MSEIITRTNIFLWLLTGRAGDFANSSLNNNLRYSVKNTPDVVKRTRALLNLHDTRTDFYVLAALAAAEANTSLTRQMLENSDAVFLGGLLQLPPSSSTEPLIPNNSHSWPYIDGVRAGADGFVTLTFSYEDVGTVIINHDAGGKDESSYILVALDGGGYRLSISKAEEYGVMADFNVTSWGPGATIRVNVSPSKYPYDTFADKIAQNDDAIFIMTSEGTMQAFSESSNPATKVGLLALAIIRRMVKIIDGDQAGFAVTAAVGDDLRKTYSIEPAVVSGDGDSHVGFDA